MYDYYIGQLIYDSEGCIHEIGKLIYDGDEVVEIISTFDRHFKPEEVEIVI